MEDFFRNLFKYQCKKIPEGGLTSRDVIIKKCDELNVNNHKVIIFNKYL